MTATRTCRRRTWRSAVIRRSPAPLERAATTEAAAVGDASTATASASGAQVAGARSPAASATVTLRCVALRLPLNGVAGRATCLLRTDRRPLVQSGRALANRDAGKIRRCSQLRPKRGIVSPLRARLFIRLCDGVATDISMCLPVASRVTRPRAPSRLRQ